MGCGADDRGRDVSWHPNYRESEPLAGHFTSHECLFGRNPGRPKKSTVLQKESINFCSIRLLTDFMKASTGYMMIKLAVKPSYVSTRKREEDG